VSTWGRDGAESAIATRGRLRGVMRRGGTRGGFCGGREQGQATVEFALILIPLLTVVAGIIYFGIGLNYWLDMNRVANQGARQAAVNNWPPQCPRTTASCTSSGAATPCGTVLAANSHARLQDVLRCSPRNDPCVAITSPGGNLGTATIGDPVQVELTAPYKFFFFDSLQITLAASATSRLEQLPSLISASSCP
jgi:Flp pilus assembly protein TadG